MGVPRGRPGSDRRGFSMIELLVALTLGLIVLGSVYKVFFAHSRLYSTHRATMDVRQNLRGGAALLSWELSTAAATAGDLYAIAPGSVTFRSLQASGVVCSWAVVDGNHRFGLQLTSGVFQSSDADSALVYDVEKNSWMALGTSAVFRGEQAWATASTGGGTPVCFWGDSTTAMPRPQVTLELQGDASLLDRVEVGALVRGFQRAEYTLIERNGRWWMGRRGGGGDVYSVVTGPMLSPARGGLTFGYYDAGGNGTSNPADVARVDITLRGVSIEPVGVGGTVIEDSLTTSVFLRGNAR